MAQMFRRNRKANHYSITIIHTFYWLTMVNDMRKLKAIRLDFVHISNEAFKTNVFAIIILLWLLWDFRGRNNRRMLISWRWINKFESGLRKYSTSSSGTRLCWYWRLSWSTCADEIESKWLVWIEWLKDANNSIYSAIAELECNEFSMEKICWNRVKPVILN